MVFVVLTFVAFWKQRTGRLPEELIFDSKLTTYANLNRLNPNGGTFHDAPPAFSENDGGDRCRAHLSLATDRDRGRLPHVPHAAHPGP